MTTSTDVVRARSGSSTEEVVGGLLQHIVAEIHSGKPSRRALLQSNSDTGDSAGSKSFDIQIVITLAILLCVMICVVALHTLLRHMTGYRQCGGDDCSVENRLVQVESLGSEKTETEYMSAISFGTYKSPLQSLDESSECAICLGEFGRGEEQRVLPNCKHSFHAQCIAMWLCAHTSCPTCRDEIVTRPQTPASTWSGAFSGDEGMLRSDIIAFRRSPRLFSSPAFRSSSLFTMLAEDGSRAPTMLFAEALSPSPYDYDLYR